MITALALSLTLSAMDPALAGGSHAVPPPPEGTVVVDQRCQIVVEDRQTAMRECPRIVSGRFQSRERHETTMSRSVSHASQTRTTSARQSRTVTLSDDFFSSGLTGGVERPNSPYRVYGRSYVVIGGSHASVSAGQAAAARGLPRASH